jgi:uncharacterized protein
MQYRPLGKTGDQVSVIGLGCAPMMTLSLAAGTRLVRRAVELGLNYIDTARGYGETEVMVGQALQGQRQKVFLSTKTAAPTRAEAWREILDSLQRLQTDYLDNCHLHALSEGEDMERRLGPGGALEALLEARQAGLIRHIGCTAHTSRALLRALERFDFEIILIPMNIVEREPLDELIPLCRQRGVGVTIMKPVATGLLPARPALKWLLNQPIATIVPGVTTLEELELNAAIARLDDYTLSAVEQAQVNELAQQLEHVRCRVCRACEPYCPQNIWLGDVLGSEVMYDHYRTMGRETFASSPWAVSYVAEDYERQTRLVSRIQSCGECRKCEEHCPYGLPAPDMLQAMLPGLKDMLSIYEQRLRR